MSDSPDQMQNSSRDGISAMFGTGALLFAVVIVAMGFVDASEGLPFSLPRSWYTNRPMWYLLALMAFALGWFLLKRSSAPLETETDSHRRSMPNIRFQQAVLYTRKGCHLCEEMRQLLEHYQRFFPTIVERDIATDAELTKRFTDCVPVLEIDGKVRFRGRINEVLLKRLIEATPPRPVSSTS